ncbi:uncharacterized protein LOC127707660 isoform X11 [Mytilus californianus]|uniref:uncharacterized protein LOC127707660 isoform X11 n=1 Tax=Mytilus californianus TaxID=6549 RepID=UPI0022473C08|nr:uncharacterized protein LOC127707660 isoform X11 [Mytilus californianus]
MYHRSYLSLRSILWNMNILSCGVIFHVLIGIHGKGIISNYHSKVGIVVNTVNWHCKGYNGVDGLFSCIFRNSHNEKSCMEIIKMVIHSAMHDNLTKECLVEQSKLPCTKCNRNNSCTKKDCRYLLSVFIEKLQNRHKRSANDIDSKKHDDATSSDSDDENENMNGKENGGVIESEQDEKTKIEHARNYNDTTDSYNNDENKDINGNKNRKRKKRKEDREYNKKQIFKLGAIVGISVGITGTIILLLIILVIIFVCRQRSKKKKRKQMTRLQSVDQRFEMAHLESSPSSTNKEQNNFLSTNKSLNTDEAQSDAFVLDPFVTKYDKDLSNRKLPVITRFSGAEGDENVYYEIDEYKIESSTDMERVHKKQIEEVKDQGSHQSHQTKNLLGSKKNREQFTRLRSVDQRIEMANLERSLSITNKGGNTVVPESKFLNTGEAQSEYFVLDPSVTKYDKDMSSGVLPEFKRFSVAQGDEKVNNEIDKEKIESSTDMKKDNKTQIEKVRDIASYHTDLTNNQNQLGFDNTTYNVSLKEDNQIY